MQARYPGTNEDLELASPNDPVVYTAGRLFDVKQANPGDVLRLRVSSRNGGFDYSSLILGLDLRVVGQPAPPLAIPGLALDLATLIVIENGVVNPFGGGALVTPEGWNWVAPVPSASGLSLVFQAVALPGSAAPFTPATPANGIFAATDAH